MQPNSRIEPLMQTPEQPFEVMDKQREHERREHPRRAYPYVQLLAPRVDEHVPDLSIFRQVTCQDIASGGFSFLSRIRVNQGCYIVALGSPPLLTYVTAEVVHQTPVLIDETQYYSVGCRYTGRLDPHV